MVDVETHRRKYEGLSHDEIIERQNKGIRDILKHSSQPRKLNIDEPVDVDVVESVKAYTRGWEIEEGLKTKSDIGGNAQRLDKKLVAYEKRLRINDFKLGGLGEAGKGCGETVLADIDIGEEEDGVYGVRYHPVNCLRIECPRCYSQWALQRTFDIVMKIEAMALIREVRPFHVVFSVPPNKCHDWTWTNINDRLWKRGVRHLKRVRCKRAGKGKHRIEDCPDCHDLKIDEYAGAGVFHPLRVKRDWKKRFNADPDPDNFEDLKDSGKFWKNIRYRIAHGHGQLSEYAKLGYHTHSWVFNDHPHKHRDKNFLVHYLTEGDSFKKFTQKEVVALTRYLITHTCVINESTSYLAHRCSHCGHYVRGSDIRCHKCGRGFSEITEVVRNRIIHPIRAYGMMHDFNPKEALINHFGREEGTKKYHELAEKICSLLIIDTDENGDDITLSWDREAEELVYPAYQGRTDTADGENWISVWKVFDLLVDSDFLGRITDEEYEFLEDLADCLKTNSKPPPLEKSSRVPCAGMFYVPPDISVEAPIGGDVSISYGVEDFELQNNVLEMIDRGEDDIFKIDICLPDNSFGEILSVINRLKKFGVVGEEDGALKLNYVDLYPSEETVAGLEPSKDKRVRHDIRGEIVRLVRCGISDADFLRSHFPDIPTYRFNEVLGKMVEDGALIRQPNEELILGVIAK